MDSNNNQDNNYQSNNSFDQQPTEQPQYNGISLMRPDMSKEKSDKVVKIAVIVGIILAVSILIFTFINGGKFLNNSKEDKKEESSQDSSDEFKNLTKEEAIAFLRSQDGVRGILPENYIGNEITDAVIMNGNTIVSDLNWVYSYDNLEELEQAARNDYEYSYHGGHYEGDLEIKEYDYYAIITPVRVKGATSCDHGYNCDCDSLLSFKREYLDYHREEEILDGGGISWNDVVYIKTRDPKIVSYLLRVVTFFSSVGWSGGYGNIYSYDFEEQDDKFVLTVNNVGAGINMEMLDHPNAGQSSTSNMWAINLYRRRFVAEKSDGLVHVITINDDGDTMETVKSIPITRSEFESFPGYGPDYSTMTPMG